MKKFLTLIAASFCVLSLSAFDLDWSGTARARGGIVSNPDYNDDSHTQTWRSQRVQILMEGKTDDNVQLFLEVKWGDGDPLTDANKTVKLNKAYIFAPNFIPTVELSAGIYPFAANSGMVLDDNFFGYHAKTTIAEKFDLSIGMFLIDKGNNDNADNDAHGIVANLSAPTGEVGTLGLDFLAKTNCLPEIEVKYYNNNSIGTFKTDGNYKRGNLFWFNPYYNFDGNSLGINGVTVDFTATYMVGSWDAISSTSKNIDAQAFAVSLKPTYTSEQGTVVAFDVFYSSGAKGSDVVDGDYNAFMGIAPAYSNGLEYFGDGGPTDESVINLGASKFGDDKTNTHGALMLALVCDQPIIDKLSAHAAIGWAQTAEDVIWVENSNKKSSKELGTEFDLGFNYQATETLCLKVTGAYIIPGEALYTSGSSDNRAQVGSYLEYSF